MNLHNHFIIIMVYTVLKFCNCFTIFTEKVAKIDRFEGQCSGQENLPMTFHNLSFFHIKRRILISGKLIVKHDLNHQIKVYGDPKRCRNRESLDTCEQYQKLRHSHVCDLLNVDNQFWSPFVASIKPRIRCPVKAGTYSLTNGTFDVNVFWLPVDGWYWRIHVTSFDTITKEQLLCMKVEGELQVVRKN